VDLESKLEHWVTGGLITADQAAAIREAEAATEVRRAPLVAQALGYLGGSLALVAAVVAVAGFWDELDDLAKVGIGAAATLVFCVAGLWTRTVDEPAIRRLTSFLWFLAAGSLAFAVALAGIEWTEATSERTMLVASLATLLLAAALWRLHPAALQQVAVVSALAVATIGSLLQLEHPPDRYFGLVLWGLGVAWILLARAGLTPPRWTGFALGSAIVLTGSQIFSFGEMRTWGLALGLVTAVLLIAASVLMAEGILLGFGAAGVFLFVPQAMFAFLGEALGAALALFSAGIVLVVAGLVLARLRGSVVAGGS
jgi:hypothetical protein